MLKLKRMRIFSLKNTITMNKVHAYWWRLNREDGRDNYGDILAPYLISKLSKKKIVSVEHPMMRRYRWFIKHYLTIGSIISHACEKSIVWGSGIIIKNQNVRNAKFVAVRGPQTRRRLLELGYEVPEVYGDPALLLPMFISNIKNTKYKIGIIPHYVDYEVVYKAFKDVINIKVIDLMTDNVERTTKEILECESIISSSLHGIIVSHAFFIPALWVKFSNKLAGDNIKFYDYFESVDLFYKTELVNNPMNTNYKDLEQFLLDNSELLTPNKELLELRKKQLLQTCPF